MRSPFSWTTVPGPRNPGPEPNPNLIVKLITDTDGRPNSSGGGGGSGSDGAPGTQSEEPKLPTDNFYSAWDKFLLKMPKRRSSFSKKIDAEKALVDQTPGEGLQIEAWAFTSWEQAAAECRAKVAAIVEECRRLNRKYRDPMFALDEDPYCLQALNGKTPEACRFMGPPPEVKRISDIFDKPQFFLDGAAPADVHQGYDGDCWFLAALMAITAKHKQLVEQRLCVAYDEKVGVYGFLFFRDGEWIYEVIDDKLYLKFGGSNQLKLTRYWDANRDGDDDLPMDYDEAKLKKTLQKGAEALYFSHCKSEETWVPLIEKAYAKAHGDYCAIEGGQISEAIEDLTGGVATVIDPEDIMDKDRFWTEQLSQVNKKYLFGGGSKQSDEKGIAAGHAYTVLDKYDKDGLRLLKIRNPWGEGEWTGDWSDGSKKWTPELMTKLKHSFGDDGVFWMSYDDFLEQYRTINRVRLFTPNWHIAQCWTCCNIPWTVDYLDTKFQFTLGVQSSVVVVLSQPDDRYYRQLSGRYCYSLHFRIYKVDQTGKEWLIRSMHNSGSDRENTRSVSAEIDELPAGVYDVQLKVTAKRYVKERTAESVILENAAKRKEKLLAVGRRFDFAQSKGNLRALEESNQRRAKQEANEIDVAINREKRILSRDINRKTRAKAARIDKAMRARARELAELRRQRDLRRRATDGNGQEPTGEEDQQVDGGRGQEATAEDGQQVEGEDDQEIVGGDSQQAEAGSSEDTSGTDTKLTPDTNVSDEQEATLEPDASINPAEAIEEGLSNLSVTEAEPGSEPVVDTGIVSSEEKQEVGPDGEVDAGLQNEDPREGPGEAQAAEEAQDEMSVAPDEVEVPYDDDEDYIPDEPEQLDDDDFEFDPDIDVPTVWSEAAENDQPELKRFNAAKDGIFKDDPWNCMCCLGLRIYTQHEIAKVEVIKGENRS